MARYKRYPPRWGHIHIPVSGRDAGRAGLSLYAPCRPRAVAMQRSAWKLLSLVGPRALPGRTVTWNPPMSREEWDRFTNRVSSYVGSFDAMAVYEPPQAHRSGFALLLLRAGRSVAHVRFRLGSGEALELERRVLEQLDHSNIRAFWHPRPFKVERLDEWSALISSALAPQVHRPAPPSVVDEVVAALQGPVAAAIPRPADVPEHWEPMHGDLTPWNLRVTTDGLVLVDWEAAGWGPPGADSVLYRATAAVVGLGEPGLGASEAVEFWRGGIALRETATGPLDRRVQVVLADMEYQP